MDDQRFDAFARVLVTGRSRRSVLSVVAGLAAAQLGATSAKKRHRRQGKARVSTQKTKDKVTVCHHTGSATNPVVEITISPNAVDQHINQHGDSVKGDCCIDSECSRFDDACNVGRCVIDDGNVSTCRRVPTPGEPCDDENRCTTDDQCVVVRGRGVCRGTPRDCSDTPGADACNEGVCNSATGDCTLRPREGAACSDDNFCTVGDTCVVDASGRGVCRGEPRNCAAEADCDPDCEIARCVPDRGCLCEERDPLPFQCRGRTCRGDICGPNEFCCANRECCDPATQYCGGRLGCCIRQPGPCQNP
jgi:hypothetical protein